MFYSNVPTDFHHKKMHLQWEGIEGCVKVKKWKFGSQGKTRYAQIYTRLYKILQGFYERQ